MAPLEKKAHEDPRVTERDRKAEHIRLALESRMQFRRNFFDDYFFEHRALPEIRFEDIDTSCTFLGKRITAPLLISCMTGGTPAAGRINENLARGAETAGVALGLGSQRKAIEDPTTAGTYRVRPFAPSVPLLANLGAVQLNYGYGIDECRRAVEMIDADALVFHANALQEAIQPEGQHDFAGLLGKIGAIAGELEVPVIVKEVGCGISRDVALELLARGVRIVDTAGLGGTSWARIEACRAHDRDIGELFANWGIPTPLAIRRLRDLPDLTIIGSGGVRNGLDVAKSIACGAHLAGLAFPFLQAAEESESRVIEQVNRTVEELKICMLCVGASTLEELREAPLLRSESRDESRN